MTPVEYLYSLELHGIKLGLDGITRLLAASGNPQLRYPTVHVAGTNGKGSVVALLDAMLRAAGYRTGRFTSPHLCHVHERFLVDRTPLSEEALDEQIEHFRSIAERSDSPPTFFELNTAIAFRYFAEANVDIALIEVGLGGRYDSTNVIEPVATAITNIALEHTKYLGDTLEAIAFEKAGILKAKIPAVVGEIEAGPRDVILARAAAVGAPVALRDRDYRFAREGDAFSYRSDSLRVEPCPLALPGAYQGANAAVAVALAESLREPFSRLSKRAIIEGLATVRWPCRLETVLESPTVIIDVAHNAAGARELASTLEADCIIILAIANDKDAGRIIDVVSAKASTLILSAFTGERALPVADLCARAAPLPHLRCETLDEAIALGMKLAATENRSLVIAGSLFAAGEARTILIEHYGAPPLAF